MNTDKKIVEELIRAYPHLNPNALAAEVYGRRLDELSHAVNLRDGYRLVGYFDSLCDLADADYFAIVDTLAGAVVYGGFVPGAEFVEVGMLRADYLVLEQVYLDIVGATLEGGLPVGADNPTGLLLNAYDAAASVRRRMPLVTLAEPEIVVVDGETVFGKNHLPLHGTMQIRISIFDAIPDDYDLTRVLYHRMKRLNASFKKSGARARRLLSKRIWNLADSYNGEPHQEVARLMPSRSKSIPLDEAFPTRKLPFGPVEIRVPHKTTTWVYEDSESLAAQVKCLQEDALDIATEIDRICRTHGIGYFVCGGTMLGLVRHDGFIPWDDDMDVGMLRADYERFLEVAPDELADRFFLQTRESDPNIPYLFSKVRLRDSEYITAYNELRDFNKGICVDIFPFDRMPLENGMLERHLSKMKRLARAHNKIANRQVPHDMPRRRAKNPAEALGHAVMTARHKTYWGQSLAKTQDAYHEAAMEYNDDESLNYVASYVPTFTCVRLDDLLPYQDIEFEGAVLKAPAHPEVFLQMQYGDYMTEPLPHQQRGHGLLRWKGTKHSSDEFEAKENVAGEE